MPLEKETLSRCLEALDQICANSVAELFSEPVDPVGDQCPDYFDKIKKASDISTVRANLNSNKYDSVQSFKDEVNLIWSNAILYNGSDSLIGIIATSLKQDFKKITAFLTNDQENDWINKMSSLCDDLSAAIKVVPPSIGPSHSRSLSIKSFEEVADVNSEASEEVTQEMIEGLAKDIESLTDPAEIQALMTCLKACDPELIGKKQSIDVNLAKLPRSTLFKLRDKVKDLKEYTDSETE